MGERDEQMAEFLSEAGIPHSVTEHALSIDAILQQWRRRFGKRELGQMALHELELDIDLAKYDVLTATWAPSKEFDDAAEETMVSTIATRLGIDPSRASRLVSELIGQGLVRRDVSQQDARRTIVALTNRGAAVVEAVRTIKFLILGDFLKGWSEEEIETFLPLLERFSTWADQAQTKGATRMAPTIAALRDKMHAVRD